MMRVQPIRARIAALDILRGFALFGILLVNMLEFSGSTLRANTLGARGGSLDQMIDMGVLFFAVTKFYLLFSFLFGVGFAVQMRRTEADGRPFVGMFLRRLLILFGIGLIHSILIWQGDILRMYAIAGVILVLFRALPTRLLLGIAAAIGGIGLIVLALFIDPNGQVGKESIPLFINGSYAALVSYRLTHPYIPDIQTAMILVMFILGLVVGRDGWLDQPERYQPLLRRWWKVALPVGLVGNALLVYGLTVGNMLFVSIGVHIGAPALSFSYLCFVVLNTDKLTWLAPLGQVGLTVYLSHSLIFTTVFYGYGLGLYDRLLPTATLLLAIGVFALQVFASHLWMARFRFGPVEWVWRSLTYGTLQPMRVNKTGTTAQA
jgi:uncharacterized protein